MAKPTGPLARLSPVGVVERTQVATASAEDAFAVASSYQVRLEWDPFVSTQHLINTDTPGKGVRTFTRSRHGLGMVSEYLTYRPPTHMGMKMVTGPWFFRTFSGSWHFKDLGEGRLEVVYRYRYDCRPAWLQPVSHCIGNALLGRDIERRVAAFVRGIEDPVIVARAQAEAAERHG
ncbi:SRPBCC family protein [Aquihabitans sp. G128]|uniref:type II toxin-antitoxin system RatA family toxin n=1 Tax=Aquihabitans sp. G128 TaxID=2849779 RepID=UPI001C21F9F9|nr:SRPBCC family protein [Aquihabitans sp. G128]QXC61903.1 SRPBCC family protein [Aquihabitans sp. G128]